MYVLSGLVLLGVLLNAMLRPVADKYFMTDEQLAAEQALGHDKGADHPGKGRVKGEDHPGKGRGVQRGAATHPVFSAHAWLTAAGLPR